MREAVIISIARTPIGKAYRGAFNDTTTPTMTKPVIEEAIRRAEVEPGEVDDVIMGATLQGGRRAEAQAPNDIQEALNIGWIVVRSVARRSLRPSARGTCLVV